MTGGSEDGTFNHFLSWTSSLDAVKHHLETAPKNTKYISMRINDELIACCKAEIQEDIVKNIKKSQVFFYRREWDRTTAFVT